MELFRSWQESLKLFLPSNFKLFMLTVLKSTLETYGYIIYYMWWLVLLFAVSSIGYIAPEFLIAEHASWAQNIFWFTELCIWFALILVARPSVREKGPAYFKEAVLKNIVGFFAAVFLWANIRYYIGNALLYAAFKSGFMLMWNSSTLMLILNIFFGGYLHIIYFWMPLLLFPAFIFTILFYADSDGTFFEWLNASLRSAKMVIYNWPFCFISLVLLYIIIMAVFAFSEWAFSTLVPATIFMFCIQPLIVTYFKNFYIKRLHDQFKLYYPRV